MTTDLPEPKMPATEMIEAVERLATFMETLDGSLLEGIFAKSDVTIIENFAPHVFKGPDAARDWAEGMRDHVGDIVDLRHSFGAVHDFSRDFSRGGARVFFTLKTTWTGKTDGVKFHEEGGWSFVLVAQGDEWRVQAYGWAVTDLTLANQNID